MTTVFIVEDNVPLGNLYKRVLEGVGLSVVQARNCQEAYEQLETVIPSALLLDLTLPDGNGYDIVDYVKERPQFNDTRIAVVSGYERGFTKSVQQVETYLQKPVSTVALLHTVQALTGQKIAV